MTWDEFWGDFNPSSYAVSIEGLSESELRRQHAIIRQKSLSANAGIGAGAAGAFHTAGLSLFASGVSYRKRKYNNQKQSIIEARMQREGWPLIEMRVRDLLLAVGPSAVASFVVPGAEHVAGHFITHAAGHGAATYTAHHTADMASSALHHPAAFAHAAEQGMKAQVDAVEGGFVGHATQLVPTDAVANGTTSFLGNTAGQAAASAMELKGVDKAVGYVTGKGMSACLDAAGKAPGGRFVVI